jgi:hypothetical protein
MGVLPRFHISAKNDILTLSDKRADKGVTSMHAWERVRRIERILGVQANRVELSRLAPGETAFQLSSGEWITFGLALTKREQALIEWLLSEEMKPAKRLGLEEWIKGVLDGGPPAPVPAHLNHHLPGGRMPALLVFEQGRPFLAKEDLTVLLDTYFAGSSPWLVGLNECDWLLFVPLREWIGKEKFTLQAEELLLEAASGLQEALADELGLTASMVLAPPIVSWEQLPGMWQRMAQVREAVRSFRMEKAVWVTWKPRLERLLTQLDNQAVKTFLAEMPGLALLREEEMRKTIEAFLRLDLNISETARHLYVHRNTLLYRFDRVKQETGLDVRRFADAMLIKVVLLLLNHQEGER